jgi:hypothetical protein
MLSKLVTPGVLHKPSSPRFIQLRPFSPRSRGRHMLRRWMHARRGLPSSADPRATPASAVVPVLSWQRRARGACTGDGDGNGERMEVGGLTRGILIFFIYFRREALGRLRKWLLTQTLIYRRRLCPPRLMVFGRLPKCIE